MSILRSSLFSIALCAFFSSMAPVSAETDLPISESDVSAKTEQKPPTEIKRWSLEAGIKMLLLDYQVRVNYRLPILEDHWSVYASYAPLTAEYDLFPGRFHNALLGARYYLNPSANFWQNLYVTGAAGASFNPTGAKHPNSAVNRDSGFYPPFFAYVGGGGDYMFHEHWGINGQLGALVTLGGFSPQAELNLKYAF
jgi:hypothetical protein